MLMEWMEFFKAMKVCCKSRVMKTVIRASKVVYFKGDVD